MSPKVTYWRVVSLYADNALAHALRAADHMMDYSRSENQSDSDLRRELDLRRQVARRRAEQAKQDWDLDSRSAWLERVEGALQSSTPEPRRHSAASVDPHQRPLETVALPPWPADNAAAAAAAASASHRAPAFTDGPYTGPQAPLAIRRDARPSQLFARAFGTYLLGVIWLIEALNYCVHVIFRPEPWNAVSVVSGYALWALQLASLARCLRRTCTACKLNLHTI